MFHAIYSVLYVKNIIHANIVTTRPVLLHKSISFRLINYGVKIVAKKPTTFTLLFALVVVVFSTSLDVLRADFLRTMKIFFIQKRLDNAFLGIKRI